MRIDVSKLVFTTPEVEFIIAQLEQAAARGLVAKRTEDNRYLLASYTGLEGASISPKWNVKVYTFSPKKRGHSLVCVDRLVLEQIVRRSSRATGPISRPRHSRCCASTMPAGVSRCAA